MEVNPGLPDAPYDEAVRQVAATSAIQSLVATNREKAPERWRVQATRRAHDIASNDVLFDAY